MDVGQDSPIIIQSDDDDDDDVLLIKEEKAPSAKKDEDDVIFVSEERSPVLKKGTSSTQAVSSSDGQSSSSDGQSGSASDGEDVTYGATQLFPYTSEFSSVSAIDNIIRPLDLSSSPLTTLDGAISTSIIACVDLPDVSLGQSPASNPDNPCLDGGKLPHDADLNLGKLQSVFDIGASKMEDLSPKSHSFLPLKLTGGRDADTLNTPVCKMDLGKESRPLLSSGSLLSLPRVGAHLSTCNSALGNSSQDFFLSLEDISVNCCVQDKSVSPEQAGNCKTLSDLDTASSAMPIVPPGASMMTSGKDPATCPESRSDLKRETRENSAFTPRDEKHPGTSRCDDATQQSSSEKSIKKDSNTILDLDVDSFVYFLAPDVIDSQKPSDLVGLKKCVNDLLSSSDPTQSHDSFSSVASVSDSLGKHHSVKRGKSHNQLSVIPGSSATPHPGASPNVHLSVRTAQSLKHSSCRSGRATHKRPLTAAVTSSGRGNRLPSSTEDPHVDKKGKVNLDETAVTLINCDRSLKKGQSKHNGKSKRRHRHFRRLSGSEARSDHNVCEHGKSRKASHASHRHKHCETVHARDVQVPVSHDLDSVGNSPDMSDDIGENQQGGNNSVSSNLQLSAKDSSKVHYNAVQGIRNRYIFNRRLKSKKSAASSVDSNFCSNSPRDFSHLGLNAVSNSSQNKDGDGHSEVDEEEAMPNSTRSSQPHCSMGSSWGKSKAVRVGGKHKKRTTHVSQWSTDDWFQKHFGSSDSRTPDEEPRAKWRVVTHDSPGKVKLKVVRDCTDSGSDRSVGKSPGRPELWEVGPKKALIKRHTSMVGTLSPKGNVPIKGLHRSMSDSNCSGAMVCVTCSKSSHGKKLSRCEIGHGLCATCLEDQVKAILTGKIKQRNIKCPSSNCDKVITFDELKQTLPQFVVDILEEKLDKAYLNYITQWMFTNEKLKTRSEFATSETVAQSSPAISVKKYEDVYTPEPRDPAEDLPPVWTKMERGAPIMVFEVVPDTEEYTALALQFHETLDFPRYEIVRIIRVQNPILWKYFALKRSEMVQENDGMDVAEMKLFHGTHRSTLEAIARKGFDWRLSGKHGTVYGCGSYFARESRYSHGYTDRAGSGVSVRLGGAPSSMFRPIYSRGVGAPHGHLRPLPVYGLSQPTVTPLMGLPTSLLSQTHPPQPPPAHFHLPPPPPAHGQLSSLQVPAHNQTSGPLGHNQASGPLTHNQTSGPQPIQHAAAPACLLPSGPTNLPSSSNSAPPLASAVNSPFHLTPSQLPSLKSVRQAVLNTHGFLDSLLSGTSNCGGPRPLTSAGPSQSSCPQFVNSRSLFPTGSSSNSVPWPRNVLNTGLVLEAVGTCRVSDNSCLYASKASVNKPSGKTEGPVTSHAGGGRGSADLASVFCMDAKPDSHFMFVARVLVGRHTGGSSGLKRPPPLDQNNPFGKCYDSCVDNIFSPQVYVIFDSNQAYPEYVIEYTWSKDQEL